MVRIAAELYSGLDNAERILVGLFPSQQKRITMFLVSLVKNWSKSKPVKKP